MGMVMGTGHRACTQTRGTLGIRWHSDFISNRGISFAEIPWAIGDVHVLIPPRLPKGWSQQHGAAGAGLPACTCTVMATGPEPPYQRVVTRGRNTLVGKGEGQVLGTLRQLLSWVVLPHLPSQPLLLPTPFLAPLVQAEQGAWGGPTWR